MHPSTAASNSSVHSTSAPLRLSHKSKVLQLIFNIRHTADYRELVLHNYQQFKAKVNGKEGNHWLSLKRVQWL